MQIISMSLLWCAFKRKRKRKAIEKETQSKMVHGHTKGYFAAIVQFLNKSLRHELNIDEYLQNKYTKASMLCKSSKQYSLLSHLYR